MPEEATSEQAQSEGLESAEAAPEEAKSEEALAPSHPSSPRPPEAPAGPPKPDLINSRVLILAALLGSVALMAYPPLNNWAADAADRMMASGRRPPPTNISKWQPGAQAVLDITVVTEDVWRLACASDQVVDGAHCGFKADKTAWPPDPSRPVDDNRVSIIQPFRTENGNQLVTVTGIWAEPEIAARVHTEPPRIVPVKRQKRFTARCDVEFIGKLEKAKLQWQQGSQWFDQDSVLVARTRGCRVKTAE